MDRSSQVPFLSAAAAVMLAVALSAACTDAYVSSSSLRQSSAGKIRYSPLVKSATGGVQKCRDDGSTVSLYLFPTPPSSLATNPRRRQRSRKRSSEHRPVRSSKTSLPAMSDSVLAPCDTLPSFQTAHGLLSPEVFMRISDATNNDELELGGPLHEFLKTYRSSGPMACLPLLSDPIVLPELTRAMREIA